MKSTVFRPKVIEMSNLTNLFIELTAKNCNQHCKHCYIDFPQFTRKCDDFIGADVIARAISDSRAENIECIYLTGAEPMTHPDFNAILRLCLTRANVCICTNGSFINEKKARFLKKVESESDNEIIFKISMDHYDEMKNDDIRYRGAFRHAVFAVKHLVKYEFNPIICVTNYYNLSNSEIIEEFSKVLNHYGHKTEVSNFQIIPWHDKSSECMEEIRGNDCPDCKTGRILTASGVYACPFLANDYRGRCGSSFADYNKKSSLETSFCNTCMKSENQLFSIDFSKFA